VGVARPRQETVSGLIDALRDDLDVLVQAACHLDPQRRYPSVAELRQDVRRYLEGYPLDARPDDLVYRTRRLLARHRMSALLAFGLCASLVAYSVTVTLQARQIRHERDRARRVQAFALGLYDATDPTRALGPELSAAELVDHGVERVQLELAGEEDIQAELYAHLGKVYERLGRFEDAERLFRTVLEIEERSRGADDPAVASALHDIGNVLIERDDPDAHGYLRRALEMRTRIYGADHPTTGTTLRALGNLLRSQANYPEAQRHLSAALAIFQERQRDSVEHANALTDIAWLEKLMNKTEQAESRLRTACRIYERALGPVHPDLAVCWNNLADSHWRLKRWSEGDRAMERSLAMQRQIYGAKHPNIATSLGNLATSRLQRGLPADALDLYQQTLDMRRSLFGDRHPRVAQTTAQLAETQLELAQAELAVPLFREALAIFEEQLPPRHPSLARVQRGLGTALIALGNRQAGCESLELALQNYAEHDKQTWVERVEAQLADCAPS
jgi:serine/threonine-protein kinase